MNSNARQKSNKTSPFIRMLLFPVLVLILYSVIAVILPDKALLAIKDSGKILLSMLLPLGLIFILMLLINLFMNPARVARYLGKGSGVKGAVISAIAGIISTGPIYAWYPLLKELKEKGAGESSIAIFLHNRAVKPFLLPIMVAYFGWIYVTILTVLTVLASILIGFLIAVRPSSKRK